MSKGIMGNGGGGGSWSQISRVMKNDTNSITFKFGAKSESLRPATNASLCVIIIMLC